MIIFIRHSKEDKKISKHRFDEHISLEGKISAENLGEKIIRKFGSPDIIYTSPYNRTLETAKALINESNNELYFLNELSRFYPKREPIDLSEKTKDEQVPLHETKTQFKKRIKKLLKFLKKESKKYDLIWCVTHTSVLKEIAKLFNIEMNDWIKFNDYIIIKEKDFKKLRERITNKEEKINKIAEINLNKNHICPYCKFKENDRSVNRTIGIQKLFS